MHVRAAVLFALVSAGCATSRPDAAPPVSSEAPATEAPAGKVRVVRGETVTVAGVAVRFEAVTEDSRCPPDVQCVWAGRAHVRLAVDGDPVELSVPGHAPHDAVPSEATLAGVTVRVLAITPKAPSTPAAGGSEPQWVELEVARA